MSYVNITGGANELCVCEPLRGGGGIQVKVIIEYQRE